MRRFSPCPALRVAWVLAFASLAAPADARAEAVELELVLAVDASSSVNRAEFDLQVTGIARAFGHPSVLNAIEAVGGNGIAVTLLQWSGTDQQKLAVPWTRVHDPDTAGSFGDAVGVAPRYVLTGGTAIGQALEAALAAFEGNGFEGRRRAIDISGDGRANVGLRPEIASQGAAAAGITINGLAILNEEPGLDRYYLDNVIGGPGAFLMTATNYDDFATAIRRKLIQEIAGAPVASREPPKTQENVEGSAQAAGNP
ncbi:DUF1194 domain-containing protein [Ferruginivarius sediminum]|uniref:DUF1194 domain-containing protein n=1 Tax=Ferruginivarius sediminum TaxID=2661937 RepID=A0A369TGS3_9PROT|nr:DUF1194 domain-containing protein [Ferruginivarius sediminum]